MLNTVSKDRIFKFIDRCNIYPNYSIAFYLYDLMDEVKKFLLGILDDSCKMTIELVNKGTEKLVFDNGSYILLTCVGEPLCNQTTNIIYMDDRIRENYIFDVLKPHIEKYRVDDKLSILNPKPIYITFEEGELNEKETNQSNENIASS